MDGASECTFLQFVGLPELGRFFAAEALAVVAWPAIAERNGIVRSPLAHAFACYSARSAGFLSVADSGPLARDHGLQQSHRFEQTIAVPGRR